MGLFFIMIALLIAAGLLYKLAEWLYNACDYEAPSVSAFVVAACSFVVALVITGSFIGWVDGCVNRDIYLARNLETRQMYVDQLTEYEEHRDNKVVESDLYLELRKSIINFNEQANRAAAYKGHWWSEGLIWDPCYVGIEPIVIERTVTE